MDGLVPHKTQRCLGCAKRENALVSLLELGWTVVFAMAISLFDAMTMAPLLSSYLASGRTQTVRRAKGLFAICGRPLHLLHESFERLQAWLTRWYEKIMWFCLKRRGLVLALSLLVFVASLGLLPQIKKTFWPLQDTGFFQVNLEAAPGTSLESMRTTSQEIERILRQHPEIEKMALQVGNEDGESNVANYFVELVDFEKRSYTTSQLKDIVRQELKPFAAARPRVGDVQMGGATNSPFSMLLVGDDLAQMSQAAETVKSAFARIPGLADVDSNYRTGKPEYQVLMDPKHMEDLGVSAVTAGTELRGMVDGVVPAKFREGDKEYDIRVRLKPEQRDLRQGLSRFFVPNMNGNLIRLSDVASARTTDGPLKINRRDRQRYIMISGELGPGGALGTIQEQAQKIMKTLTLPAGVSYQFIGEAEDLKELFINIVIAMLLAVVLIFLVLASLFESIILPFLIMLALPLAMVGALGALYVFNQTLDMFSMIGLVMLLGLVAKNSILLVDYTLQLMRRGMPRQAAIIQAGRIRLRPILMTTIALIAGMLPLALALTEVSRFKQSMGISIIGGLLVSTLLTLVVIPSCFEWADDLRLALRKLFRRPALREIDIMESEATESQPVAAQLNASTSGSVTYGPLESGNKVSVGMRP